MVTKKLVESMREVQNARSAHKAIISEYEMGNYTPMDMLLHMFVIEERILKAINELKQQGELFEDKR